MLVKLNLNRNLNVQKNVGCILNVVLKINSVMDCKNFRRSRIFESVKLMT